LEKEDILSLKRYQSVTAIVGRGLLFEIELLWKSETKEQSWFREPGNTLPEWVGDGYERDLGRRKV
jgi:hypothetical protein